MRKKKELYGKNIYNVGMYAAPAPMWAYNHPVGRALEWHSRGQRFDPAYLHHLVLKTIGFQDFFFVKTAVLPSIGAVFKPPRYTSFARYTSS